MFDLSQLDEDFSVSQVLRRNWMSQTGIDPMAATRDELKGKGRKLVGFCVIATSMIGFLLFWPDFTNKISSERWLALAILLIFLLLGFVSVSTSNRSKEEKSAEEFAEALERLCEILNCGAADMALMSSKELRDKAECVLIERAGVVKQKRENGAHFSADKFMVDAFNPAHELFLSFGLVEENYDRFFADQKEKGKETEPEILGGGVI